MQRFQHILFVSHGAKDDLNTAKQAIILANENQAHLSILLMCPEFPAILDAYKDAYQQSLVNDFNIKMTAIQQELGLTEHAHKLEIQFDGNRPEATQIVQRVLEGQYDLLIKAAESNAKNIGFKALDMDLIRKCPCPVWLHRSTTTTFNEAKFAVAIDPESAEASGRDLAIKLLKMADLLTKEHHNPLSIISCWDYALENTIRNSPFIDIPEDHILNMVHEVEVSHRRALDSVLKKVNLNSNHPLYHQRGIPDQVIPELITKLKIDVLVMGTVGRTGIPGFIIGNTAENVLQKISCSLLALKPDGYVSPVSSYRV